MLNMAELIGLGQIELARNHRSAPLDHNTFSTSNWISTNKVGTPLGFKHQVEFLFCFYTFFLCVFKSVKFTGVGDVGDEKPRRSGLGSARSRRE